MGVLVKTSLFICILWGIHIWIKQVIDTEENNQKMEETLENMNHSYKKITIYQKERAHRERKIQKKYSIQRFLRKIKFIQKNLDSHIML